MNPYLEPQGFLGTGASLLADLTLVAYILLIVPAMLLGYYFARTNKHRPHHKWTMIGVTIVNWVLIIVLMLVAYGFDVVQNIGQETGNARYLVPTIHGILGLAAQLLATYAIYRMLREDTHVAAAKKRGEKNLSQYWFTSAKPVMRLTLVLWLATSLLGVFNYLFRYDVIPNIRAQVDPALVVVTPEVAAPAGTAEVTAPAQTEEATEAAAPAVTEAAALPAATEAVEIEAIAPVVTEAVVPPAVTEEAQASATTPPTATRPPATATTPPPASATRRPAATPDPREMLPTGMAPQGVGPSATPTFATLG